MLQSPGRWELWIISAKWISSTAEYFKFSHLDDAVCFLRLIFRQGNECVDVKEGTLDTIIESNYCTGQLDEDSGGIDSRADKTIIRYNKIVGCKGAGVRLGGHKVDDIQYGIHCEVSPFALLM